MPDDFHAMSDYVAIRRLLEDWAVWRDTGDWDRLATVWHPAGRMVTTWGEATGSEFIARSRKVWDAGVEVLHLLAGSSVDVKGDRAVAQTKMQILQRGTVHGTAVDVICTGRFCDAMERHEGRWTIRLRQPVYEMDHMSPVNPNETVALDAKLLGSFPPGYRHLGYLQSEMGLKVTGNLPGTRGPAAEQLRTRMARWLAGDDAACLVLA